MTSPFSYSSNPADGGIIYLDGLTAEKEQSILIVSFNDLLISPEDIEILEKRPSISEEETESINSKNLPEAEKKKLLDELKKKTTEEKKAQKKEAKKIAYDIAAQFNTRAAMNGRCKNKFMSVVLSFPDSEREMLEKDPQKMEDIVQDWLDGMGFENAQHFAVYHPGTAQPHIHIYVGMVGPKLKVYNSFQTKYRSQQVNRNIEEKYGLKPGIGIDKNYEADLEKTDKRNKARLEIRKQVQYCLDQYVYDIDILKNRLDKKGIQMKLSVHNNGKPGFVFSKDKQPFNGGDLGRMYTYGNLTSTLEDNRQKLQIFEKLTGCVGLTGDVKYKKMQPKETNDESNKTKAQHRRKYQSNGIIAYAYSEKKEGYAIFCLNENYYITANPVANDLNPREQMWMSVDGTVCSFVEIFAANMSGSENKTIEKVAGEKQASGKTVTVTTTVSGGGTSSPAPTFVPTGKTVRDNKSAAHTGDGLDETEEIVDENGNKVVVKKRKKGITL